MELETRTPDEMLDGAMKRIISIAEAVIKMQPRLKYVEGKQYQFPFDKGIYVYAGPLDKRYGIEFEKDFFHMFRRITSKGIMVATKYSESPIEVVMTRSNVFLQWLDQHIYLGKGEWLTDMMGSKADALGMFYRFFELENSGYGR